MRNAVIAVAIFLAIVAVIVGLLFYFDILAQIALPYYLVTKTPKIDEFGNYRLEDAKGKGEDAEEGKRKI